MDELPPFRRVPRHIASRFIHSALTGARGPALIQLRQYEDYHYRAIFAAHYFVLAEGSHTPSKSQWSTLKKKLKRRNPSVFVLREHGQLPCPGAYAGQCLYIEFGFLPR